MSNITCLTIFLIIYSHDHFSSLTILYSYSSFSQSAAKQTKFQNSLKEHKDLKLSLKQSKLLSKIIDKSLWLVKRFYKDGVFAGYYLIFPFSDFLLDFLKSIIPHEEIIVSKDKKHIFIFSTIYIFLLLKNTYRFSNKKSTFYLPFFKFLKLNQDEINKF